MDKPFRRYAICRYMANVITGIGMKHQFDFDSIDARLSLINPPSLPLVLEKLNRRLISVAHYMDDPATGERSIHQEIVFYTLPHDTWIPVETTQHGEWHQCATMDEKREHITQYQSYYSQRRAGDFAFDWVTQLVQQDWYRNATVEVE